MINAGELGWVPTNEPLIVELGKYLGSAAYGAVDEILKSDLPAAEAYFEDFYVGAVLLNRLGLDPLIKELLDDNAAVLADVHSDLKKDQITLITQELLKQLLEKFNAECKAGDIPEQLKKIPVFDFR